LQFASTISVQAFQGFVHFPEFAWTDRRSAMPQVSGSGGSNPSLPPAFYI
jgi:hypothetical protein